jgi:hypothetical protein
MSRGAFQDTSNLESDSPVVKTVSRIPIEKSGGSHGQHDQSQWRRSDGRCRMKSLWRILLAAAANYVTERFGAVGSRLTAQKVAALRLTR